MYLLLYTPTLYYYSKPQVHSYKNINFKTKHILSNLKFNSGTNMLFNLRIKMFLHSHYFRSSDKSRFQINFQMLKVFPLFHNIIKMQFMFSTSINRYRKKLRIHLFSSLFHQNNQQITLFSFFPQIIIIIIFFYLFYKIIKTLTLYLIAGYHAPFFPGRLRLRRRHRHRNTTSCDGDTSSRLHRKSNLYPI